MHTLGDRIEYWYSINPGGEILSASRILLCVRHTDAQRCESELGSHSAVLAIDFDQILLEY